MADSEIEQPKEVKNTPAPPEDNMQNFAASTWKSTNSFDSLNTFTNNSSRQISSLLPGLQIAGSESNTGRINSTPSSDSNTTPAQGRQRPGNENINGSVSNLLRNLNNAANGLVSPELSPGRAERSGNENSNRPISDLMRNLSNAAGSSPSAPELNTALGQGKERPRNENTNGALSDIIRNQSIAEGIGQAPREINTTLGQGKERSRNENTNGALSDIIRNLSNQVIREGLEQLSPRPKPNGDTDSSGVRRHEGWGNNNQRNQPNDVTRERQNNGAGGDGNCCPSDQNQQTEGKRGRENNGNRREENQRNEQNQPIDRSRERENNVVRRDQNQTTDQNQQRDRQNNVVRRDQNQQQNDQNQQRNRQNGGGLDQNQQQNDQNQQRDRQNGGGRDQNQQQNDQNQQRDRQNDGGRDQNRQNDQNQGRDQNQGVDKPRDREGAGDGAARDRLGDRPAVQLTEREQRLVDRMTARGARAEDVQTFRNDLVALRNRSGLSQREVSDTLTQVERLMDSQGDRPTSQNERRNIAMQIVAHAARPTQIDQGRHNTCNVTTVEERMFTRQPSRAAEMITTAATTGSWTAPDGRRINMDAGSFVPGTEERPRPDGGIYPVDGQRSHASQIFQVTAVNDITQRRTPPLTYRQERPTGAADTGERLYNGNTQVTETVNGVQRPVSTPTVSNQDIVNIGRRLTGESGYFFQSSEWAGGQGITTVGSGQQLAERVQGLARNGQLPATVYVDANHPAFGGTGNAQTNQQMHVVSITGYNAATGRFQISNQWGAGSDVEISSAQLYAAMQHNAIQAPPPPRPQPQPQPRPQPR